MGVGCNPASAHSFGVPRARVGDKFDHGFMLLYTKRLYGLRRTQRLGGRNLKLGSIEIETLYLNAIRVRESQDEYSGDVGISKHVNRLLRYLEGRSAL